MSGIFLNLHLTFYQLGWAGWPVRPRAPPALAFLALRLQIHATTPTFYVDSGGWVQVSMTVLYRLF